MNKKNCLEKEKTIPNNHIEPVIYNKEKEQIFTSKDKQYILTSKLEKIIETIFNKTEIYGLLKLSDNTIIFNNMETITPTEEGTIDNVYIINNKHYWKDENTIEFDGIKYAYCHYSLIESLFPKVLEIYNLNKILTQQIFSDHLTGALSRNGFKSKLSELIIQSKSLIIIFCDINNFKEFNDEHGHNIGDGILKFVVKTIKKHIRKKDAVVRYGGDEFIILLNNINLTKAKERTKMIINELIKGKTLEDNCHYSISMSVGIKKYNKDKSYEENIKLADEAMYKKKKAMCKVNDFSKPTFICDISNKEENNELFDKKQS